MYDAITAIRAIATVRQILSRAISSLFLPIINEAPCTYPEYNCFDFVDSCSACFNCFPNIVDSVESLTICLSCVRNSSFKLFMSCNPCVDCCSSSADRVSSLDSSASEIGRNRSCDARGTADKASNSKQKEKNFIHKVTSLYMIGLIGPPLASASLFSAFDNRVE